MVVVVVVVVVGEGEAAAAVTSLVAISGLPLPSCFASHGEVREEETAATASVLRAPPPRLGGSMLEAPRGCGGDTSSSRPEHARPLMSVMLAHAYMFMAASSARLLDAGKAACRSDQNSPPHCLRAYRLQHVKKRGLRRLLVLFRRILAPYT